MAKNPVKAAPAQKDAPLNMALNFFIPGCLAELFLMTVQRYYVNGSMRQVVAWDSYLKGFSVAGIILLVAAAVLAYMWRADSKRRLPAILAAVFGAFIGISSFVILRNLSVLGVLVVLVPVLTVLGIIWSLYDRECAMSLTVLSGALVMLWLTRRTAASVRYAMPVKVVAVVAIVLCIALALLLKQNKLPKLLSPSADKLPVYVGCGLGAVMMAIGLISGTIAYYSMWALAVVVFGLAVYYTVKQL